MNWVKTVLGLKRATPPPKKLNQNNILYCVYSKKLQFDMP